MKKDLLDAKAMNVLVCSLSPDAFSKYVITLRPMKFENSYATFKNINKIKEQKQYNI